MKFNGRAVLTKLELHRARKRSYISRTLIARSRCSHFTQSLLFFPSRFSLLSPFFSLSFFHNVVKIHTEKEARRNCSEIYIPLYFMETATASSRSLVFKSHYPGDKIIQRAPGDTSIMQKVRISIAWLVLYSITGRNTKESLRGKSPPRVFT